MAGVNSHFAIVTEENRVCIYANKYYTEEVLNVDDKLFTGRFKTVAVFFCFETEMWYFSLKAVLIKSLLYKLAVD